MVPCRCSSDTRKFAIKTFYKGNLRFVFVNHLQAVKHESNKHNKQDHGGLPIITITGRKSVCQSIRSLIHPDYSPLSRGTRVPTITVYEVTEALINIKRTRALVIFPTCSFVTLGTNASLLQQYSSIFMEGSEY